MRGSQEHEAYTVEQSQKSYEDLLREDVTRRLTWKLEDELGRWRELHIYPYNQALIDDITQHSIAAYTKLTVEMRELAPEVFAKIVSDRAFELFGYQASDAFLRANAKGEGQPSLTDLLATLQDMRVDQIDHLRAGITTLDSETARTIRNHAVAAGLEAAIARLSNQQETTVAPAEEQE